MAYTQYFHIYIRTSIFIIYIYTYFIIFVYLHLLQMSIFVLFLLIIVYHVCNCRPSFNLSCPSIGTIAFPIHFVTCVRNSSFRREYFVVQPTPKTTKSPSSFMAQQMTQNLVMPSSSFCFLRLGKILILTHVSTKGVNMGISGVSTSRTCHPRQEIAGPARGSLRDSHDANDITSSTCRSTWTGHEAPPLTAGPVVSGVWCDLAYEDLPKLLSMSNILFLCGQNHPKSSILDKYIMFFSARAAQNRLVEFKLELWWKRAGFTTLSMGAGLFRVHWNAFYHRDTAYITSQYTVLLYLYSKGGMVYMSKTFGCFSCFDFFLTHHRTGAHPLFSEIIISLWLIWNTTWSGICCTHWLSKTASRCGVFAEVARVAGRKGMDPYRWGNFLDVDLVFRWLKLHSKHTPLEPRVFCLAERSRFFLIFGKPLHGNRSRRLPSHLPQVP